ncbi:ANTAR domain-containing response regulator [Pseudomonas massiliensis]|uniref:ANTAR domain-containing response regulator n=1 Tax=Pseudomonas massiliensis TaxID=522492 RepID=UPI00058C918C|nr:ANTAR domain-containing protein [Pseudomonas massiliensis]
MKARAFPPLGQGHVLLIDCDERSQAQLDKSLARLGIDTRILRDDNACETKQCFAAILEVEHFNSPGAVAEFNAKAIPLVALTAHETLSQIQRALQLGATALLNKPISQGSVYTTLMMAVGLRDRQRTDAEELAALHYRLSRRPLMARALARLMVDQRLDEATAYERLRTLSMQLNRPIEALCEDILATQQEGQA